MDGLEYFLDSAAGLTSQTAPATSPEEGKADRLRNLEQRIDKLILASSALWSLLKEHTPLTDTDIDLRDGQLDGRLSPPITCVKCGKKSSRRHARCLWCGVFRPDDSPFESV